MTPTPKQLEAMKKLLVAPALQNPAGAELGLTKLHDGSTLKGNTIRVLRQAGWLTRSEPGSRTYRSPIGRRTCTIYRFELTEEGRKVVESFE